MSCNMHATLRQTVSLSCMQWGRRTGRPALSQTKPPTRHKHSHTQQGHSRAAPPAHQLIQGPPPGTKSSTDCAQPRPTDRMWLAVGRVKSEQPALSAACHTVTPCVCHNQQQSKRAPPGLRLRFTNTPRVHSRSSPTSLSLASTVVVCTRLPAPVSQPVSQSVSQVSRKPACTHPPNVLRARTHTLANLPLPSRWSTCMQTCRDVNPAA